MGDNNIFNVTAELGKIRRDIGQIQSYTSVVDDVNDKVLFYKTNVKLNILAIVNTIYMLMCFIGGMSGGNITIGFCILSIMFFIWFKIQEKNENQTAIEVICWSLSITTTIFIMLVNRTIIPVVLMLFVWLYTIYNNNKLKNQIWEMLSSL